MFLGGIINFYCFKKLINFFHNIMKSLRLEKEKKIEDNIIKDVRNLFRLKKRK